jgi:predicted HTH domain antitoxin
MQETTFNIQVSSDLLGFGVNQEQIQQNVNEWLVLSLFTEGHISSGKAAKLLEITRIEFLNLLRKRGIAYIDFNEEELAEELATVNALNL